MEKTVPCYKVDSLVALMLSFRSVQSSLAICEFRAAGEERCERGQGQVCVNLGCRVAQSASEQSQLCELSGPTFGFTTREFSMVGGYMKNPENNKTVQLGGGCLLWTLL